MSAANIRPYLPPLTTAVVELQGSVMTASPAMNATYLFENDFFLVSLFFIFIFYFIYFKEGVTTTTTTKKGGI